MNECNVLFFGPLLKRTKATFPFLLCSLVLPKKQQKSLPGCTTINDSITCQSLVFLRLDRQRKINYAGQLAIHPSTLVYTPPSQTRSLLLWCFLKRKSECFLRTGIIFWRPGVLRMYDYNFYRMVDWMAREKLFSLLNTNGQRADMYLFSYFFI